MQHVGVFVAPLIAGESKVGHYFFRLAVPVRLTGRLATRAAPVLPARRVAAELDVFFVAFFFVAFFFVAFVVFVVAVFTFLAVFDFVAEVGFFAVFTLTDLGCRLARGDRYAIENFAWLSMA